VDKVEKHSEKVKSFLDYIRQAEENYHIADMVEYESNNEQQDILHQIELQENFQMDYICLGIAMQQIRQKRRHAKNEKECLLPLLDWSKNNKKAIKELEQALGRMRKTESNIQNRSYSQKSDIVEKTLNWQEDI
jgi:hypothetical protein